MKYLLVFFLLTTAFQSCHSQDTANKPSPLRLKIDEKRSDSLAIRLPKPRGFISDFVNIFSIDEIRALDSLVSAFERTTTVEIAVATVDSSMVKREDFEDYTLVMARTWGVGKKEKKYGILIVISPDLRRMRIQNGDGIENFLSDSETKYIVDSFFLPKFKDTRYFEGTRDGIIAIINKLKQSGL